jgi:hypothetical protein
MHNYFIVTMVIDLAEHLKMLGGAALRCFTGTVALLVPLRHSGES